MGIKEAIAMIAEIEKQAKRQRAKAQGLSENDYVFVIRKPEDSESDKKKVKGKANRFPINDEHAAKRAVGISKGLPEAPWWFAGTVDELREIVRRVVHDRYPDLNVNTIEAIHPKKHATPKRPEKTEPPASTKT
jgi:hypothetical protein